MYVNRPLPSKPYLAFKGLFKKWQQTDSFRKHEVKEVRRNVCRHIDATNDASAKLKY
jgi:hypothetical protein